VAQQLQEASRPLPFDAAGEAKAGGVETAAGFRQPSFSQHRRRPERATPVGNPRGWRAGLRFLANHVLLDEGEYQFVGKVRTEGLQIGPGVTRGGVTLRMSGERLAKMVPDAAGWTTLSYDFTMPALADIELLCEFRGSMAGPGSTPIP